MSEKTKRYCKTCGKETPLHSRHSICDDCKPKEKEKYCTYCGKKATLTRNQTICPECRTKRRTKFCTYCGVELNSKYSKRACKECRYKLDTPTPRDKNYFYSENSSLKLRKTCKYCNKPMAESMMHSLTLKYVDFCNSKCKRNFYSKKPKNFSEVILCIDCKCLTIKTNHLKLRCGACAYDRTCEQNKHRKK